MKNTMTPRELDAESRSILAYNDAADLAADLRDLHKRLPDLSARALALFVISAVRKVRKIERTSFTITAGLPGYERDQFQRLADRVKALETRAGDRTHLTDLAEGWAIQYLSPDPD